MNTIKIGTKTYQQIVEIMKATEYPPIKNRELIKGEKLSIEFKHRFFTEAQRQKQVDKYSGMVDLIDSEGKEHML